MPKFDLDSLKIVHYPDPRLKKASVPVEEFDDDLRAFVQRMCEIMRAGKGVGLAAPQVGVNLRIFVCNLTGEPEDDQAFINPELDEMTGAQDGEEGCLSFPDMYVQVRRAMECTIRAQDVEGKPFELHAKELPCRVWQHEFDHLNGTLISDRMGPGDRIKSKKKLKEFEAAYKGGR